ncbi:hypothetical protein IMCC3317_23550 [Kordia antarctica]|uniref:Uncharacterized protein n=1 Tax=Kordia antarctica TaxID=1218801 RepID=A0A7L4ZM14_9FLAO|nr:hypothetical protein [Kordia antarctica]QHI36984.1 hypothetical protein IMCC3317_23550 [Kordia antarctica]
MYLIWALLNTAFVILFFGLALTLFTKGKQLFNNKYGNAIIVVFVLGVITMLGAKERDFSNTRVYHSGKDIKGNNVASRSVKIEETIPFALHFDVSFKKNDKDELVPSSSRSNMSGFTSGYDWQYMNAAINKQENGTFSYDMSGVLHWYLFGIKVYSESKDFTGVLE